jgi:tetratricopeptide (TPR) repeat protein
MGQLEVFIARNFPQTYAMRSDSSFVSDSVADGLFGVTQAQAVRHYTRNWQVRINERKKNMTGKMYRKYVKDPLVREGIRLDTVLMSSAGDFIYRYSHTFRPVPGVRKVNISLRGSLYQDGLEIAGLTFPEDISFYISSLSSLVEDRVKYRLIVLERRAYDNTKALLDFRQGSAQLDTTLGDNASELRRVRRCVEDVLAREEFELDSLKIIASCSLEGRFELNRRLSSARAETVMHSICETVPDEWKGKVNSAALPENWDQFSLLVENDTVLTPAVKRKAVSLVKLAETDPDRAEYALSRLETYRYMREKIYPKLRSVKFEFHMHRVGMVKDTIHTTEIDTVYMSGLEALRNMDYKRAVSLLRPYRDYNSALALTSADYNHTALDVLRELSSEDSRVCYLMALVLSRLEQRKEAEKYLKLAIAYDPMMKYRANLDPELSGYVITLN